MVTSLALVSQSKIAPGECVGDWFQTVVCRHNRLPGGVGAGSVGLSALVTLFVGYRFISTSATSFHYQVWQWIDVAGFSPAVSFHLDALSLVFIFVITFVGFLIHVYSAEFMADDDGYARFFAYLNLFVCSMLTLVLADNLVLLYLGWEGVGLCSYLLIGFWYTEEKNGYAARKAFIVTRVGDTALAIGLFMLFQSFNTLNIQEIAAQATQQWTVGSETAMIISLLLLGGAVGKSAQLPLQTWLPDAMAGPTPVSALIHAATMVTAGVYMIARSAFLFSLSPVASLTVAVVGAVTAIFAATIGLKQWDIKKVLAYSTISQLGYMFVGVGVGAYVSGMFHLVTHAFFKALLFLGSGSVIQAMHTAYHKTHSDEDAQDMRNMGGLKRYLPVTCVLMWIATLAISGIPPLSGFFSKDEILGSVFARAQGSTLASASWLGIPGGTLLYIIYAIGLAAAFLTAVYMTRMMVMTFWGTERFRKQPAGGQVDEAHASAGDRAKHTPGEHVDAGSEHPHPVHDPHESPWLMTAPLVVLAILSTVGGFIGVPYAISSLFTDKPLNYIEHTLDPIVAKTPSNALPGQREGRSQEPELLSPAPQTESAGSEVSFLEEINEERLLAVVSVLIAMAGIAAGWVIFKKRPLLKMPRILENKYYVDEIYDAAIIHPIEVGAREGLWKLIDVGVIDGLLHSLGEAVTETGRLARHLQAGFVRGYAAIILAGALILIGFFAYLSVHVMGLVP